MSRTDYSAETTANERNQRDRSERDQCRDELILELAASLLALAPFGREDQLKARLHRFQYALGYRS